MKRKRREPEVPEEKVPVVECLDGPARITSNYKTKSGCRFGEKCSYAQRQVDEKPSKRSKKNDDESAVAMLKKYDLHDRTWQLVVNRDESHDRSEKPVVKRATRHELKHRAVGRRSSNTRQLGCVFQDMKPPKSILRKSSDMQKPIQRVKFTKAIARHTKNSRPKSFARIYVPR